MMLTLDWEVKINLISIFDPQKLRQNTVTVQYTFPSILM